MGGKDVARVRAEGIRRPSQEGQARESRAPRIGIEATEIDHGTSETRDREVITRGARDGAGNGQIGAVRSSTRDGPGLGSAENQRGTQQDGPCIIVDSNPVRGDRRGNRQGRGDFRTTLRDGHTGDAARRRSELEATDREVPIERGHISRRGCPRNGTEDEFIRDTREALGVHRAGSVGGEVGSEADVIQRGPADVGTHAPVKVGGEGRRGQRDGGIRLGQSKGVATKSLKVT